MPCRVKGVTDLSTGAADAIVLVTDSVAKLPGHLAALQSPLEALRSVNAALESEGAVVPVQLPAKRLVFAPTGPLNRDYDDVRRFAEAAEKGIQRWVTQRERWGTEWEGRRRSGRVGDGLGGVGGRSGRVGDTVGG